MDYTPVRPAPAVGTSKSARSSDAVYYRRFRKATFVREYAPVTSISFVPSTSAATSSSAAAAAAEASDAQPDVRPQAASSMTTSTAAARAKYAVTAGARVQVYNAKSGKVTKTISRFSDVARGASWRHDGRLIVAGDDSGLVQVFDVSSRAILRTFKGHKLPVHVSRFSSDASQVLTASDDRTVRLWDIPTQEPLRTFTGHTDYVRAALASPDNPALILSGSYDGTVRLWDTRASGASSQVITMRHGAPVESALVFPTGAGGVALSAGGPTLRVWDLMMGGRCVRAASNHAKTITALALSNSDADADASGGGGLRLLSAGLDGLVKVYDPARDYAVTHTMRYPGPLLSLAVSPDDTHLATGAADGTLCVRTRILKKGEAGAREATRAALAAGTHEAFMGATTLVDENTTPRAETVRTKRLAPYDAALRGFRYGDALDAALRKGVPAPTTFALLNELRARSSADGAESGLRRAITGRDEGSLEPFLRFLLRHASDPAQASLICDAAHTVIDVYASILGQSPLIDDLFGRLWAKVADEVKLQRDLQKVRGALDMVIARSALGAAAL